MDPDSKFHDDCYSVSLDPILADLFTNEILIGKSNFLLPTKTFSNQPHQYPYLMY